jgi:hypothetical protein
MSAAGGHRLDEQLRPNIDPSDPSLLQTPGARSATRTSEGERDRAADAARVSQLL